MIFRSLETKILERLKNSSSVALLGPRQVGKTTLAFNILDRLPSVYLDLENRTDLLKVQDIEAFHRANNDKLIILDEVQRLPEVFSPIRGLIDSERRKGYKTGHFLFLGSASIELIRQSGESLAGRISYMELGPVNALEFTESPDAHDKLNQLWLRGGFPESLLAADDQISMEWRKDFIKTYLERDIPQFGPRIPSETFERFWMMLAHIQGTNPNASKLAAALEISGMTVGRYIDLLVDLLLIRKLQPYTINIKKRLVKSPRIYLRDSGIVHALLNIGTFNDLLGNPIAGKSWEGFVIENILSILPQGAQAFYYLTAGGAEIDLIIDFGGILSDLWAIEIKRSPGSGVRRGFYDACSDLNPGRKFLVHAMPDSFPMKNNILAISLFDLMKLVGEKGKY